ncbi:MAG: plasma-membrane proton-efflux P-type ATPase [Thermoplasmata archaeon]|nr:plasma-membrane proton-efflux P-type ATPase [Thermoplasmata archaeon]
MVKGTGPAPTSPPSAEGPGLSSAQAKELLGRYGPNEIPEKHRNPLLVFLGYFWGPIPWMIEVAAALALLVENWDDLSIILVLLVVNGVVGFWEEHQAGNAVAALRAKLAVNARVLRDGAWALLPARQLVPGDRVRLRMGDVVPADTVLAAGSELELDQSTLTGESLPVTKNGGDTAYSSSLVARGEAAGVVSGTGPHTFFGRTSELVQVAHTVSHFQHAVLRIGNALIVTAAALAAVIEIAALLRGERLLDSLQFALILTVAAIPVAMPTVLSVTMAVGARKLAGEQAVVTRLSAMEELAGMDVLCSDKTGTLTQNKLTVGDPYALSGHDPREVLLMAALASREENQDPIDLAILSKVPAPERAPFSVLAFTPFDPKVKRTEVHIQTSQGTELSVSKGACQVLFELTHLRGEELHASESVVSDFAARGFRTLGVARREGTGPWHFLGVLPLYDPLRPDAREVVRGAQALGVQVKVLTGDQLAIGKETSRQLGLGTNILPAEVLHVSPGQGASVRSEAIDRADGFAQVFPEDKYAIVERLQAEGRIVGMTGDGVNDAPALKKADAGVAVSGATDVARGAASLVLLTPGLRVLVRAVEESRRIFQRMTSYAIYRVGETIRILLLLSLSILAFALYPVTAIMIVLLAVLNDGAILSIAYDNATVAPRPVRWEMRTVLVQAFLLGMVGVAFSFLLFFLALKVWVLPFAAIQTLLYLKLSVAGHLGIFATRTKGPFWSSRPANLLLVAVVGTQAVATLIAVSGFLITPLPLVWVGVAWAFSCLDLVVFDQLKSRVYGRLERRGPSAPHRSHLHLPSPRAWFYAARFVAPSRRIASERAVAGGPSPPEAERPPRSGGRSA